MLSRTTRSILALAAIAVMALQPTVADAQADECLNATITQRNPQPQTMWPINAGTYRVLGFWTNQPDSNQAERKLFLAPNQYVEVIGGGTLSSWPASCERQARDGYDRNSLPAVTTDQLGQVEWLCCDSSVLAQWEAYLSTTTTTTSPQTSECPDPRTISADSPQDVEVVGPAIAKPWWNNGKAPWGQTQTQSALRVGQQTTFVQTLGRFYVYENTQACRDKLDSELNRDSLARKDVTEYRTIAGLTR